MECWVKFTEPVEKFPDGAAGEPFMALLQRRKEPSLCAWKNLRLGSATDGLDILLDWVRLGQPET